MARGNFVFIIIIASVVLSYLNDGLTFISFSWEKTIELMVEFHCHQPKRSGKSNINKDSRIHKTIV